MWTLSLIDKVKNNPHLAWTLDYAWPIATYEADCQRLDALEETRLAGRFESSRLRSIAEHTVTEYILAHPGAFEARYPMTGHQSPWDLLRHVRRLVTVCRDKSGNPQFSFCDQWLEHQLEPSLENTPERFNLLLLCCSATTSHALRRAWCTQALDYSRDAASVARYMDVTQECQYLYDNPAVWSQDLMGLIALWSAQIVTDPSSTAATKCDLLNRALKMQVLKIPSAESILEKYCPAALPHWPVIQELGLSLAQAYELSMPSAQVEYVALPEQLSV